MLQSLRTTWVLVLVATAAVLISGSFVVYKFGSHVFDACRGSLERLSASEVTDRSKIDTLVPASADLEIRYDEVPGKAVGSSYRPTHYEKVRVVWTRTDAPCACADVAVKWDSKTAHPGNLSIYRDAETGTYAVRESRTGADLAMFRKVDDRGHRFQSSRVLQPHNVSMLVFLLSLGALGLAAFNAIRARAYARTMHAWRPARLRPDGLIESESGATLGTIDSAARVPAGSVIVNPQAFEGRDIYREVPILSKKDVAPGTHERWQEGTMRLMRDSRSLAIIATVTTGLGLAARLLGT